MSHDHSHGEHHAHASHTRAFAVGIGLNLAFVVLEFVYGQRSHSLALVADAGHNLSDVLGLGLSWSAAILSRRKPTATRTYGLRRSSILAALINAIVLLLALGAIAWEAIGRLRDSAPVAGNTVIWVAAAGILVNTATALLFISGRGLDLNIRAAFLHMAGDAAVSAGVVAAGFIIKATGWYTLDPILSLVICAVILYGTWDLLRDSVNLAVDSVPEGINISAVNGYLAGLPGVADVHDLHIWGLSTTETALTAHLVMEQPQQCDNAFLIRIEEGLQLKFGIHHPTIQLETADRTDPCHCRLHH